MNDSSLLTDADTLEYKNTEPVFFRHTPRSIVSLLAEFLLVVFGVFLGLQLSNSNENRIAVETQRKLLSQLKVEYEAIEKELRDDKNQFDYTLKSTGYILQILRADMGVSDDRAFKTALFRAVNFTDTPTFSSTHTELVNNGELSNITNDALRTALFEFSDYHGKHEGRRSVAIASILDPSAIYFQAVEWNADPVKWSDSRTAINSYDYGKLQQAEGEMQVWLGYQYDGRNHIANMQDRATEIIALLDDY